MNKRISWLDTIRGLAAFNIVLAHILASFSVIGINGSGTGKINVGMFFVLSGYLFALSYSNQDHFSLKEILPFYINKIIRIYPCFLVTIILALVVGLVDKDIALKSLSLQEEYGHLWYIPVEFGFYFVAPIIGVILCKIKEIKTKIIILFGIAVVIGIVFPYTKCQENSIFFLYYFPVFLMGVILSIVDLSLLKEIKQKLIYDIIAIIIVIGFIIAIPGVRRICFLE